MGRTSRTLTSHMGFWLGEDLQGVTCGLLIRVASALLLLRCFGLVGKRKALRGSATRSPQGGELSATKMTSTK